MKSLNLLIVGLLICMSASKTFAGQSHAEHRGTGGKNNNNNEKACKEARISKFNPAALSEAAPGSDFSFMVAEANNAKQIEVTVKNIAVPVTTEKKGEMMVVHGKLPESLKATPARITVKVKAKIPKCNSEDGWLIKITD